MTCNFSAVDNCLQRLDKLKELIDSGGNLVTDVAVDLEESSNKNDTRKVSHMKAIAETYARLDLEIKQYKRAAEKSKKIISDLIKSQTEHGGELNFKEVFKETLEVQEVEMKMNMEDHPINRQFADSIWKTRRQKEGVLIEETCDDGEVLISHPVNDNLICPLTKIPMEDPVRNMTCGHHYSRKAIETHIKRMGGKARCPVVGCVNFVRKDELEADKALDLLIKRKGRAT